jgi:topoisomerase-4 subunit A
VICGAAEQNVLLATSASYGFVCKLSDMIGRNKAGKQFITIDGDELILPPVLYTPSEQAQVISVSRSGRLLSFALPEMKRLSSGGRGLILMGLEEGDVLASLIVAEKSKITVLAQTGTGREQAIRLSETELLAHYGKRARMGRMLPVKAKSFITQVKLSD